VVFFASQHHSATRLCFTSKTLNKPKRDLLKKALKIIGNEQEEIKRLKYVLDNELPF